MGTYLRGPWYHYRKEIDGRKYYRALKIKRGQEALLSERLKQVEEEITALHFGLEYKSIRELISFKEYAEKYLHSKRHKKSIGLDRQRLEIVSEIWKDPLLIEINKTHIEKLDEELSKRVKESTINRYFEVLRSFFNMAVDDNYIKESPIKYYVRYIEDGSRRALASEEVKRILEASAQIQERPRSQLQGIFYDLVLFALNTGMRLSEIINLKHDYIRDEAVYYPITLTKSRRRATSQKAKVRVMSLNKTAMAIITKQKRKGEYVFNMEWRHPRTIRKSVFRVRQISQVDDFTFHQLRHFVSTYLSSAVSLATAQTVLGHQDIKTTLRYTHPDLDEQMKGVRKIEKYIKNL